MRVPSIFSTTEDNDNNNENTEPSWRNHKEDGKRHFENENYEGALASWNEALKVEYEAPDTERQILLSNLVACRLKIGGNDMAEAAVEEAKQCIELNNRWAKAHVRLASAYIALGGGHSNDACNALQRALSLDPNNSTARQMLTQELRRDHRASSSSPPSSSNMNTSSSSVDDATLRPQPSAPPADFMDMHSNPGNSNSHQRQHENNNTSHNTNYYYDNVNIDDSPSWKERIQFFLSRCIIWYQNDLSSEMKSVVKVLLGLLILYVAFGGRFGLDCFIGDSGDSRRGNYGDGNAYDRYRNRYFDEDTTRSSSRYSSTYSSSGRHSSSSYQRHYQDDYYSDPPRYRSSDYHNSYGTSFPSIVIILGGAFICHRFLGINPFQVLWMMNMMQGRGGRFRFGGMRYGGGFGGGIYNRRFGVGGRRGRWR